MPLPKNRSSSVRRIKRKLPSGKMAIRFRRRAKGKDHSCATCHGKLQATHSSSKLKPSLRSPNRKFGGMLCGKCARRVIICQARIDSGAATLDSVEVKFLPFVRKQK